MSRIGPSDCPACRGTECYGGGNRRCIQRDPKPSLIGAILDTYGGMRVVVTHKSQFKHHVRHDELLFIVRKISHRVHEPIKWADIPYVIRIAEEEVERRLEHFRPNESWQQQAVAMYRLRRLEMPRRSLDLGSIIET